MHGSSRYILGCLIMTNPWSTDSELTEQDAEAYDKP
jgi:hypothetical protein